MIILTGTNSLIRLTRFNELVENFTFRNNLLTWPSNSFYTLFNRKYNYLAHILANNITNGFNSYKTISNLPMQVKYELKQSRKEINSFDMTFVLLSINNYNIWLSLID